MEAKVREDSPANVVESKPSCSKVRVIRSAQKLQNSCGLNQESSKPERAAVGYKLINAPLLSDSIALAAICSDCRKPSSKLELFQRDFEREGLAESLVLRCSICKHETALTTSRRLGGQPPVSSCISENGSLWLENFLC